MPACRVLTGSPQVAGRSNPFSCAALAMDTDDLEPCIEVDERWPDAAAQHLHAVLSGVTAAGHADETPSQALTCDRSCFGPSKGICPKAVLSLPVCGEVL